MGAKTVFAAGAMFVAIIMLMGCAQVQSTATSQGDVKYFGNYSWNAGYVAFASKEAFDSYVAGTSARAYGGGSSVIFKSDVPMAATDASRETLNTQGTANTGYSTTNVQIAGIDELDSMKNDGQSLYYMRQSYGYRPYYSYYPYWGSNDTVYMIDASALEISKEINQEGIQGIYLDSDSVIVVKNDGIMSYGKDSATKEWKITYPNDTYYLDSRQKGSTLYILTRESIYDGIRPMPLLMEAKGGESSFSIGYDRIYYNPSLEGADSMVAVLEVDLDSGEVKNGMSLMTNSYDMNIYMSQDNLYIANAVYKDSNSLMLEFLTGEGRDLITTETYRRLNELAGYDISEQSRTYEVMRLVEKEFKDEDRLNLYNEFNKYVENNADKVEYTEISKIRLDGLEKEGESRAGGHPLNQFSMDEYNGNLRIATTYSGIAGISYSKVFVLDKNMDKIGESGAMGEEERIYSVRFIEDKGYVVTFKQTDPLYVLDLSDPESPEITGQLKIPGYSAYLHPIMMDGKQLLLGIGMENSKLKVSLFDVSNPKKPKEVDSYKIDDWSQATYDHHAFLYDERNGLAFVPGYDRMYVFAISTDGISLEKALKVANSQRTAYIGDMVYVFADNTVYSYDESTWEKTGELELWAQEDQPMPLGIE